MMSSRRTVSQRLQTQAFLLFIGVHVFLGALGLGFGGFLIHLIRRGARLSRGRRLDGIGMDGLRRQRGGDFVSLTRYKRSRSC